jgi:hypothetical protein
MTVFLFFPKLLHVLKWGLRFDERRGLLLGRSPSHVQDGVGSKHVNPSETRLRFFHNHSTFSYYVYGKVKLTCQL